MHCCCLAQISDCYSKHYISGNTQPLKPELAKRTILGRVCSVSFELHMTLLTTYCLSLLCICSCSLRCIVVSYGAANIMHLGSCRCPAHIDIWLTYIRFRPFQTGTAIMPGLFLVSVLEAYACLLLVWHRRCNVKGAAPTSCHCTW
ncbi:hypothetical protein GGR52DRAFT_560727 [Hypoxylon sp. FL1284]|nr:hypothetical protein GGR52DRAFT_560727 [Hypoxylon sp. FL1284]